LKQYIRSQIPSTLYKATKGYCLKL